MNVIPFSGGCAKVRRYLDSYLSNELLVETNHEVLQHLEQCPACAAELQARTRLRGQLRDAVRGEPLPDGMEQRVREALRARRSPLLSRPRWITAVAAVVVLAFGLWQGAALVQYMGRARQENRAIQALTSRIAEVLGIGLGDHVHCAVFRKYPANTPPLDRLSENLGRELGPLAPLLANNVPSGYQPVLAHECRYGGRKFIHLVARKEDRLLSLVITRKREGDTFNESGLAPVWREAGAGIYHGAVDQYSVSGFQSGSYLAFVVSELPLDDNVKLSASLSPSLRRIMDNYDF